MLIEKPERLKQDLKNAKHEHKNLSNQERHTGRMDTLKSITSSRMPNWGSIKITIK